MAKEFYKDKFVKNNTYDTPNRLSFTNLTGQKFGKINVISWAGNKTCYGDWKRPRNAWWCKCDCGETDHFLVDTNSLKKGLSTSCGCNYKNNGGTVPTSKEDAEATLQHDYSLLEYTGRRKPCKAECRVCGDKESFDSFYSLQQRNVWCSCKEDNELPKRYAGSVDYTFIRRIEGSKMEASCNHCGSLKVSGVNEASWKDKCPCTYNENINVDSKPSCVYFNIDEYNPSYFKIGKADEPYSRLNQIMSSVKKEGYGEKHKFKIKHVKWFANAKVAYQVESMYHQWLKDKAVYGFKGSTSNSVFDGSNELFEVTREDIDKFNEIYKSTVDMFEIEQPEYVITKDFRRDTNLQKDKGRLGVGVWFPNITSLYRYIKIKRYDWKDDILNSSDNLIQAYMSIKKIERSRMFEVDGEYYRSMEDFYEQWKHFSSVEFKTFHDRATTKKREVWDSLISPREKSPQNKFYDLDGTEMKLTQIYDKYKPMLGYNSFKSRLLKGESLLKVISKVPRQSITKVYLYKGKYYSNQQLYLLLKSSIRRETFYGRLEKDWCPEIASLVPTSNKHPYKTLISDMENIYPEIYSKLKGVV